jgi:hypothetical protein
VLVVVLGGAVTGCGAVLVVTGGAVVVVIGGAEFVVTGGADDVVAWVLVVAALRGGGLW